MNLKFLEDYVKYTEEGNKNKNKVTLGLEAFLFGLILLCLNLVVMLMIFNMTIYDYKSSYLALSIIMIIIALSTFINIIPKKQSIVSNTLELEEQIMIKNVIRANSLERTTLVEVKIDDVYEWVTLEELGEIYGYDIYRASFENNEKSLEGVYTLKIYSENSSLTDYLDIENRLELIKEGLHGYKIIR